MPFCAPRGSILAPFWVVFGRFFGKCRSAQSYGFLQLGWGSERPEIEGKSPPEPCREKHPKKTATFVKRFGVLALEGPLRDPFKIQDAPKGGHLGPTTFENGGPETESKKRSKKKRKDAADRRNARGLREGGEG